MKTLLLDTNVIIKYPQLLSLPKDKYNIIILDVVIDEFNKIINKNEYYEKIKYNIDESQKKSEFNIVPTSQTVIQSFSNISNNDNRIISFLEDYKKVDNNIVFVTDDRKLNEISKNSNINTITSADVLKDISTESNEKFLKLKRENDNIAKKKNHIILINILVSILTLIFANISALNIVAISTFVAGIINKINIWGTILILPLIGIFLFWIRSHFRLMYGLFELVIGITTAVWVFIPEFDYRSINLAKALQLMGGLYIIVRSLDNVTKGIKKSPFIEFANKWIKIFPD